MLVRQVRSNKSLVISWRRTGVDHAADHRGPRADGADVVFTSMSSVAPCGACKFLRRKCLRGCVFAPYFGAEQGAAKFAAVHKIFGASNVAKLLLHIPLPRRSDAVLTISYEAQARLADPVYGCVATIFALQQQVHTTLFLTALLLQHPARSPKSHTALGQNIVLHSSCNIPIASSNSGRHPPPHFYVLQEPVERLHLVPK